MDGARERCAELSLDGSDPGRLGRSRIEIVCSRNALPPAR